MKPIHIIGLSLALSLVLTILVAAVAGVGRAINWSLFTKYVWVIDLPQGKFYFPWLAALTMFVVLGGLGFLIRLVRGT